MVTSDVHRDLALESPSYMAREDYAIANKELFRSYAILRAHGTHPSVAFRRVWGEDFWDPRAQSRIYAVEATNQYHMYFRECLLKTPLKDFWNDRMAVHKLLLIANDSFESAATRLAAVKELNVLFNITIVTDDDDKKKGSQMSDFYEDIGTESLRTKNTITMGKSH